MTVPVGEVYNKERRDNQPHGRGTITLADGGLYVGEFKDGKRHGHGTLTFARSEYVGEWKNDKRHGHGTLKTADGKEYVAEWTDGGRASPRLNTPNDPTRTKPQSRNAKMRHVCPRIKQRCRSSRVIFILRLLMQPHVVGRSQECYPRLRPWSVRAIPPRAFQNCPDLV
ncbi:hypothetical protein ACHAXA_003783 [Cyclostephanos tholiformis]|uniref:Uncharacterized protein n=1 Tax=Cyclostephanos tholiformis TaxID=382380 RepID=A0ABD3SSC5_9STRA